MGFISVFDMSGFKCSKLENNRHIEQNVVNRYNYVHFKARNIPSKIIFSQYQIIQVCKTPR